MNTKKWLLILGLMILLVGVGGAGWVANHFWTTSPRATAESDESSQTDDAPEAVVCRGYVDLEHGVRSLAPLHPGRVAEVFAHENQHVEAGAPLLRLDDQDAKFQVDEAAAALEAAQAQLEQTLKLSDQQRARIAQQQAALAAAGFRLDAARRMLQQKEEQLKDNLASAHEVAMTRDEMKALEALERAQQQKLVELKTNDPALAVRKARAEVHLARTRMAHARHQLDEHTLKAPVAGTVERIAVGAGDIVTGQSSQPIVRFSPIEPPLVRAEVDQEFADRVKVGQTALVKDDARSGTSWRGKVQRVAGWYERRRPNSTDPSAFTDVRTVECLITIDPGQPSLRIGQRMRVMIGPVSSMAGQ
jgi:HlyD family secretion protein